MTDLPFLLRLIDDPSPVVAAKIGARLLEYGPGVWHQIEAQGIALSPAQRVALETLFLAPDAQETRYTTASLWDEWRQLKYVARESEYLERALLALASWQEERDVTARGTQLLDRFGREFQAFGDARDTLALAQFLFDFCGLRGAPQTDFTNPANSNLLFVLEESVGLPISLTCVFILVGARVGLHIEGCNFPGHFLARDGRRQLVFDPYNRGRMLSAREVATLETAAPSEMRRPASSREIVARVLRNLSVAYHDSGESEKLSLMLSLLRAINETATETA